MTKRRTPKRNRRLRSKYNPVPNEYQPLEPRQMLAFVGFFDGTTLTLTQAQDSGDITIDNNGGIFSTTDGAGTSTFVAATNLVVELLDETGNLLNLELNAAHSGDVTINLGDGERTANFTGSSNSIDGALSVNAGSGNQTIEVAVNSGVTVGTSAAFNLGNGNDRVDEDTNDINIGTDLNMTNVNQFEPSGTTTIGGNVNWDATADDTQGNFNNDGAMDITGNFTYLGGDLTDNVQCNSQFNLTGNFFANIADGGGNFSLNNVDTFIGGTTTLIGTSTTSTEELDTLDGATFVGDFSVDFGGGTNFVDFLGTFNGTNVSYTGGDGVDTVIYDFSGDTATVDMTLGGGNDAFTLNSNSSIDTLTVDFGNNDDSFTNSLGAFPFDAKLLGLQGFDFEYTAATATLTATQISEVPTVDFDNGGANQAIRLNDTLNLAPATNLAIEMLDNAGPDLSVELISPLAGNLDIELGDIGRNLSMTGSSNTVVGNMTVNAGTGEHVISTGSTSELIVNGNVRFSLGAGFDKVVQNSTDITIVGNWNLDDVNFFKNEQTVTIGGNVVFDTTGDNFFSEFDNDTTMTIAGDFTYLGNDDFDFVNTNGMFQLTGNFLVDVGNGGSFINLNQSTISIDGNVTAISTEAAIADQFDAANGGTIRGNIDVNLGGGPNEAVFQGTMLGSTVEYMGLDGIDAVTYDMAGSPTQADIELGEGNDSFSLGTTPTTLPQLLNVDFGNDDDSFSYVGGLLTYDVQFLGLQGFNFGYAPETLSATQITDNGNVEFDNGGMMDAFRLNNSISILPATNFEITMLGDTNSTLDIELLVLHTGDLTANLGDGDRDVNFTSNNNVIAGALTINAGAGSQDVHLIDNLSASEAEMDLGLGDDRIVDWSNTFGVTNKLSLIGVNHYEVNGTLSVGGDMTFDVSGELLSSEFDNDGTTIIDGNFTYIGSNEVDGAFLNDGVTIGGDATVHLFEGGGNSFNGQDVDLTLESTIEGKLIVSSGDGAAGDSVNSDSNTQIGGNIDIQLGEGQNIVNLFGTFNGDDIFYRGGGDLDRVEFGMAGNANVNAMLLDGNDQFTLDQFAQIATNRLRVDFGEGDDTFTNQYVGEFTFNASLLNLAGFNHFYSVTASQWTIEQLMDQGNILVGTNGSAAVRAANGTMSTTLSPADNIRMTALAESGDVNVTLDSALPGFVYLTLFRGDRAITLDGTVNSIGDFLRIEAAAGEQIVELAANADLSVADRITVNLRTGDDTVTHANNVSSEFMVFRAVNEYVNTAEVTINSNFVMNTELDVQDSMLHNDGTMNVGQQLIYFGGVKRDDLMLDGNTTVNQLYVRLGDSDSDLTQQVDLTNGFTATGPVTVVGGTATGGNLVRTNLLTRVDGFLNLNFRNSSSDNLAVIDGVFASAGKYLGGTGRDTVTINTDSEVMDLTVRTFEGQDTVNLQIATDLASLFIDFGADDDIFNDDFNGSYSFPVTIQNL